MNFFKILSITVLLLFMTSLKGLSQNYKNMRIVVFSTTTNTPTLLIEGNMYLTRAGNTITVNVGPSTQGGLAAPLQMEFLASILENSNA